MSRFVSCIGFYSHCIDWQCKREAPPHGSEPKFWLFDIFDQKQVQSWLYDVYWVLPIWGIARSHPPAFSSATWVNSLRGSDLTHSTLPATWHVHVPIKVQPPLARKHAWISFCRPSASFTVRSLFVYIAQLLMCKRARAFLSSHRWRSRQECRGSDSDSLYDVGLDLLSMSYMHECLLHWKQIQVGVVKCLEYMAAVICNLFTYIL